MLLKKQILFKKIGLILLLFNLSNISFSKEIPSHAVLVSSCDRYAVLWQPFFQLLFKCWPTYHRNIYLMSGNLSYADSRVIPLPIGKEKSWSDSMLSTLEKIPESYIILFLDDYWLNAPVQDKEIERYLTQMEDNNVGFINLYKTDYPLKPYPADSNLGYMDEKQPYRVSLNAGIWKKSTLKALLKSGENPWMFEIEGSVRSRELSELFLAIKENSPFSYHNAAHRGKLMPEMKPILEKEGIQMVDLSMPYQGKFERSIKWVRGFIGNNFITPLKKLCHFEGNLLPTDW